MSIGPKIFKLSDISASIRNKLLDGIQNSFWVRGEVNELTVNQVSGHCYLNLIEKEGTTVTTQFKAHIWKEDFKRINENFKKYFGEPLKANISIVFQTKLSYHNFFGLQLNIVDIDPAFILGELEKERLETIKKIQTQGLLDLNKRFFEPKIFQRIAIISAENAKGYTDFLSILQGKQRNYQIEYTLFPSTMQGDPAVMSIISSLRRIKNQGHNFDLVAIIRGGGDELGLSCYNNFDLCKEIAEFPLPVITAIGHSINLSVADMVAFQSFITPTNLADYIVNKFIECELELSDIALQLKLLISERFKQEHIYMNNFENGIVRETINYIQQKKFLLHHLTVDVVQQTNFILQQQREWQDQEVRTIQRNIKYYFIDQQQKINQQFLNLSNRAELYLNEINNQLKYTSKTIELMDPKNLLAKGYSITLSELNQSIKLETIQLGDVLKTKLLNGEIESKVIKIEIDHGKEAK